MNACVNSVYLLNSAQQMNAVSHTLFSVHKQGFIMFMVCYEQLCEWYSFGERCLACISKIYSGLFWKTFI